MGGELVEGRGVRRKAIRKSGGQIRRHGKNVSMGG